MSVSWTNEMELQFLENYLAEPSIWDSHHPLHKDKNKKSDAWDRISRLMEISTPELKRKKDSLLSSYRKYRKLVKDSKHKGELYKPVWFAYELMEAFLGAGKACNESINTISNVELPTHLKQEVKEEQPEEIDDGSEIFPMQLTRLIATHNTEARAKRRRKQSTVQEQPEEHDNGETLNLPDDTASQITEARPKRRAKRPHLQEQSDEGTTSEFSDSETKVQRQHPTASQEAGSYVKHTNGDQTKVFKKKNCLEDDCELYGKILAQKLRKLSEIERLEFMYEIDGIFLRRHAVRPQNKMSPVSCGPSASPHSVYSGEHFNRPHSVNSSNSEPNVQEEIQLSKTCSRFEPPVDDIPVATGGANTGPRIIIKSNDRQKACKCVNTIVNIECRDSDSVLVQKVNSRSNLTS